MEKTTNGIPDLPYTDPAFVAHRSTILGIHTDARLHKQTIEDFFDLAQKQKSSAGAYHAQRSSRETDPVRCVMKEQHLYCELVQRLFHNIAMEVYERNKNSETMRNLLERVLSVRISIHNFPVTQKEEDHRTKIQSIDSASRDAGIPSLVPYLYSPNSVITRVKSLFLEKRFTNPDILFGLSELFADTHILHSMCLSMIANGVGADVPRLLKIEAERRKTSLLEFTVGQPQLAEVYLIGLVESGKPKSALSFGETIKPLLFEREKLAEKYAAALRMEKKFDEAIAFLREAERRNLKSDALRIQVTMARMGNADPMPSKLKPL